MTRSPTQESRLTAAGRVRQGASASHEYHLTQPPQVEFGDLAAAAATLSPAQMDPRERQALHQWQNALQALRRTLGGRRR